MFTVAVAVNVSKAYLCVLGGYIHVEIAEVDILGSVSETRRLW